MCEQVKRRRVRRHQVEPWRGTMAGCVHDTVVFSSTFTLVVWLMPLARYRAQTTYSRLFERSSYSTLRRQHLLKRNLSANSVKSEEVESLKHILATRLAVPDEANPQRIETLDKSPLVSGTATSRLPLDRQFAPASGMIARGLRQRNITEMCRAVGDADGSVLGLGLDALLLALNHATGSQQWYVPAKQLQLVCVDVSVAYRALATSRVVVTSRTPHQLWLRRAKDRRPHMRCARRVPGVRVRAIAWETSAACISEGSKLFEIGSSPSRRVDKMWWPPELKHISFGAHFNGSVDYIVWPGSLQTLTFGDWFNRAIDKAVLPASLQRLTFGTCFNKAIEGVSWPASLRELTFGLHFNRPISNVAWPPSLEVLTFGRNFNQSLVNVMWTQSLQELKFGMDFDQAIDRVSWPTALRGLVFGWCFNQSIEGAAWPSSLERLEFGWAFNQPLDNVEWPASLRTIKFGVRFNRPIVNVVWPAFLQQLTLGWDFNQPVESVIWPTSLQHLTFGKSFTQPVAPVIWPASLRQLDLSQDYTESAQLLQEQGVRISYGRY
ncbi:unnamed protein product [Ascophyllum nodosum]